MMQSGLSRYYQIIGLGSWRLCLPLRGPTWSHYLIPDPRNSGNSFNHFSTFFFIFYIERWWGFLCYIRRYVPRGGGEAEEWSDDDQPDIRLMKPNTWYKKGRISGTTQFDPDSTVLCFQRAVWELVHWKEERLYSGWILCRGTNQIILIYSVHRQTLGIWNIILYLP